MHLGNNTECPLNLPHLHLPHLPRPIFVPDFPRKESARGKDQGDEEVEESNSTFQVSFNEGRRCWGQAEAVKSPISKPCHSIDVEGAEVMTWDGRAENKAQENGWSHGALYTYGFKNSGVGVTNHILANYGNFVKQDFQYRDALANGGGKVNADKVALNGDFLDKQQLAGGDPSLVIGKRKGIRMG
ncbi:hypothetical protein Q3G72_001755 [Acer saccharum]|nr:hypothetical protein Q3G72_001755 [Acer saccharum]